MEDQVRQTSTHEFETNARFAATGFIVGAILGALAAVLSLKGKGRKKRGGLADRPPIIVKNGSITFHNEGKMIGWKEDSGHWTPDQGTGDPVGELHAEIVAGGGKGCVSHLRGHSLAIVFVNESGSERTFTVFIAGRKPMIRPKGQLMKDSTGMELRHGPAGAGRIASITSDDGQGCTFPHADAEIHISFSL